MMTAWAVLGGFVLDAIFGDPAWLPHPVVYMGKAISRLEKFLRARLPKTPQGELLGGAPLALTYKAINTMDSMLGYKNEKYLYFGRAAAKLDDVANYIPSRLAALLWIMAAAFTRNDAKGAWRIWRRDRRNHASPNSAQTESACAGALGVQLAGPAYYFGEYYPKPTIGDPLRPIEPEDILRADRMMYVASGFALAFGCAIRGFLG